jgi:hypothetical protein
MITMVSNCLMSKCDNRRVNLLELLLRVMILIVIALCAFSYQAEGSNHAVYLYLTESNLKLNEHYNVFVLYTVNSKVTTAYPIIGRKSIQNYELRKVDYDLHENGDAFLLDPGNVHVDSEGMQDFTLTPQKIGDYKLILTIDTVDPKSGKSLSNSVETSQKISVR